MSINLQKGQKIDLTKGNNSLKGVMVGLGWDDATPQGGGFLGMFKGATHDFDCDASAILCDANGKFKDIVYYGALTHPSRAIIHQGDNLTGAGAGDDEQIFVDLPSVPADIHKIVFVVNIYDANVRNQHFGMINNAFIRLVDRSNGAELCRFNLSENYHGMTGLVVGELYRHQGEWKFNAIGQPVQNASRVDALVNMYR